MLVLLFSHIASLECVGVWCGGSIADDGDGNDAVISNEMNNEGESEL